MAKGYGSVENKCDRCMRVEKLTFWGLAVLEGDHWLASLYSPGSKTLFVVLGAH
jgi:hypothetical protein